MWTELMQLADEYVTAGLSYSNYRRMARLARLSGVEVGDVVAEAEDFALAAAR